MAKSSDFLGFEWKRLGFMVRILLGFLVCFVFFESVSGVRPLKPKAHPWGDEWLSIRKDENEFGPFSPWNITGTYRGSWRFIDSANSSSRFPDFRKSNGNSIFELVSTPTKITGVHYVQGVIIFQDVFDNKHEVGGAQIRVEGVYIWPFRQLRMVANSGQPSKFQAMEIANSTQEEAQTKKHIFILSGQSNMAGRGGVTKHKHWDSVVPPECRPDPSVLRLNAHLHWEEAREPLHSDIDTKKVCGVGPGMSFANAVKGRVGALGLVPCAVGGTALKEWARGTHLYENMVTRAKAAVKTTGDDNGGGEIRALLWYQGESDTSSQHDAESYKAKMERLIHDVREDLHSPSLPIIQVAIASGDEKHMETVREAQKSIDLPNVVCVDAKGLPLKEDNLHLTTEAQVQLGHILADAYLKHFAPGPPTSSC